MCVYIYIYLLCLFNYEFLVCLYVYVYVFVKSGMFSDCAVLRYYVLGASTLQQRPRRQVEGEALDKLQAADHVSLIVVQIPIIKDIYIYIVIIWYIKYDMVYSIWYIVWYIRITVDL